MTEQQRKVALAQLEIQRAAVEIAQEAGLTFAETVAALARTLESLAKYAPRDRRVGKRMGSSKPG